ncbi:MAG: hypothetical protein WDW38_006370 [Sanguina aurantia]
MHRLVRLRIACPHITSLAFLSGMTSLRDLNLHVHKHRFLWETQQHPAIDLSHNQQLHTLVLHNRHMSYEVIEMIAALPALKALDLSGCTGLGGHRILPLAALTGLTSLRLEFTHVNKRNVLKLRRAMPLEMLDVRHCTPSYNASHGQLPEPYMSYHLVRQRNFIAL